MSRTRIVIISLMILLPVIFYAICGTVYLWNTGWIFLAAAITIPCFGIGLFLGNRTINRLIKQPIPVTTPASHYTERDEEAWKIVSTKLTSEPKIMPQQLTEARFYYDTAEGLSKAISRIYYPDSRDAIGGVTVLEILAVLEMASHDMSELVETYVPGSHLLTVDRLRRMQEVGKTATKWWSTLNKAYWIGSALINPANAAVRYVASRLAIAGPLEQLKEGLGVWFYHEYVRKVGHYLIELYSGRLRVGVKRYRELQAQEAVPAVPEAEPFADVIEKNDNNQIEIGLVGQVHAGKTSFIRSLLGDQFDTATSEPHKDQTQEYKLSRDNLNMLFIEPPGYSSNPPNRKEFARLEDVFENSGIVFLVTRIDHPLRAADQAVLDHYQAFFKGRPELKAPPLVVIATHADNLDPAGEWAPPYDWVAPARDKERSIAEAIHILREQFPAAVAVVPCCLEANKTWGITEYVMPLLSSLLPQAQSVALLRLLASESSKKGYGKVGEQVLSAGKSALANVWKKITG